QVPEVHRQTGATRASSRRIILAASRSWMSIAPIIRSISFPIERIPTPCIRRLLVGDLPHASGKVLFTEDQNAIKINQIETWSHSPVAMLRYGNKQPEVWVRLSSIILTTTVSDTTAVFF